MTGLFCPHVLKYCHCTENSYQNQYNIWMNGDYDDEFSHTAMLYISSFYCNNGSHYRRWLGEEECENMLLVSV